MSLTSGTAKTGSAPLRILFTVLGYKPAYRLGGPIFSVSALAESLVRKGHEVVVFTTNRNLDEDLEVPVNQPLKVDGVEVWYFSEPRFLQRCWKALKTLGYLYTPQMQEPLKRYLPGMDVVHTHSPFNYCTYAAARAAKRFRKPLFYQQRGGFSPGSLKFRSVRKRLFIDFVARPLMQDATTLIALTESELQSFRELGLKTPCRIVPNGIEVGVYRQHPGPSVEALWKIPPPAPVILFMGRVHPAKGAPRLLEAFLQIQAHLPDAVLVIAGPDEWGYESRFNQAVRQAGLQDRIIFPGMVMGEAKLDLLARADLFCLPSEGEGFSSAVLEALASGTPVLLSPGCHFPEVEQARVGRVVAPTPEAFAEAMVDLLSQPERLRAMGARGVEFVRQNYSWDHITDQLLDVYREGMQRYQQLPDRQAAVLCS